MLLILAIIKEIVYPYAMILILCNNFNISNHKRNRLEFANNSDLCKHVLHDHKVEQYTMGQLLPEVVFAILRLSMLSRIGIMKLTG